MTRAFWTATPAGLFAGILLGCSSPPSPPAQAALTIEIGPTPGYACSYSNGLEETVPAGNTTLNELSSGCQLSAGCKPDQAVVVNGAQGSQVSCTVTADGIATLYFVSAGAQFSASPVQNQPLGPTGGVLNVSESNPLAMTQLTDPACKITIAPDTGVLKAGAIWAQFDCANLQDLTIPTGQQICDGTGGFIFENCGK